MKGWKCTGSLGETNAWYLNSDWESCTNAVFFFFFSSFLSPGWSGAHTHREQSPPEFKASVLDSKELLHIPKPYFNSHRSSDLFSLTQKHPFRKKRQFLSGMFWSAVLTKARVEWGLFFFNQLTLALRWVVMISSYQILDLSGGWRQHIVCAVVFLLFFRNVRKCS